MRGFVTGVLIRRIRLLGRLVGKRRLGRSEGDARMDL
jgi:hypothetical protein